MNVLVIFRKDLRVWFALQLVNLAHCIFCQYIIDFLNWHSNWLVILNILWNGRTKNKVPLDNEDIKLNISTLLIWCLQAMRRDWDRFRWRVSGLWWLCVLSWGICTRARCALVGAKQKVPRCVVYHRGPCSSEGLMQLYTYSQKACSSLWLRGYKW